MINNIRRQLTLFVEQEDAEAIEQVRREFNPSQFELIKSHVTLCREDEIENLGQVITNLSLLTEVEIVIEFGKPVRFANGNGVFLPAMSNRGEFQTLRRRVLSGIIDNPGNQEPHITLMHPRNSTCTDDLFEQIEKVSFPTKLRFKRISLIEQQGGGKWKILQEF